jgi:hypothetical protein
MYANRTHKNIIYYKTLVEDYKCYWRISNTVSYYFNYNCTALLIYSGVIFCWEVLSLLSSKLALKNSFFKLKIKKKTKRSLSFCIHLMRVYHDCKNVICASGYYFLTSVRFESLYRNVGHIVIKCGEPFNNNYASLGKCTHKRARSNCANNFWWS